METAITKPLLPFRDIPKTVWLLIPINLFGLYALYVILFKDTPSWWCIATIIGFIFQKEIGISAGYHRLFSHYSYSVSRPIKLFILWCGLISGQGSPYWWAALHRGYHHKHSDTDKDPHSPKHGFWHSYILWLFKIKEKDISTRYIIDLIRDKDLAFSHKHYLVILTLSHLIIALINFNLWLFFMALPAFLTLHCYSIQTSLQHLGKLGYQTYDTKDNSCNNILLFPIVFGDAWHNNHHADPGNPNFGKRWWEIDTTFWIIKLLRNHQ